MVVVFDMNKREFLCCDGKEKDNEYDSWGSTGKLRKENQIVVAGSEYNEKFVAEKEKLKRNGRYDKCRS